MGGCCCRSSKRTASEGAPVYYYCPQDFVENEPLSSTRDTPSAVPVHLVDPNLDTPIPVAYEDHNALLPLVDLMNTQANTSTENGARKNEHKLPTDSVQAGDEVGGDRFEGADGLIGSVPKNVSDDCVSNSPKVKEDLSNLDKSICLTTDEEDVCPICLEEYDAENPRIVTKCKHHFHLSCILEWLERSNNCAMCDKIMEVEDMDLFDWPM